MELGYALSSEEHRPLDLVRHARRAEEHGLRFALISDHFHPWIDRQGQSPFVWSVVGGIAASTDELRLGTGVACPTICGPDPDRHVEGISTLLEAGFDHVYVHQVGSDQDGLFDFYENAVLPELAGLEGVARR